MHFMYEPWECTVQSRKSLIKAIGPQAHLIQTVGPDNAALQLQQVADRTQFQRSGVCVAIFPFLFWSLLHLHKATEVPAISDKHISSVNMLVTEKETKRQSTSDRMKSPRVERGSRPWFWNSEPSFISSANISRAGKTSTALSFRPAHITYSPHNTD